MFNAKKKGQWCVTFYLCIPRRRECIQRDLRVVRGEDVLEGALERPIMGRDKRGLGQPFLSVLLLGVFGHDVLQLTHRHNHGSSRAAIADQRHHRHRQEMKESV